MGWLITLGVLVLLAVLPMGVRLRYDSDGALVKLILGPVRYTVFPRVKNKTSEKTPEKKEKPETGEEALPNPPQPPKQDKRSKKETKTGGSLEDFIPFVKLGLDFLGDFRRRLRMDALYLHLVLASSDPCDLAVNYGKTWAAVGNLLPALEKLFVIRKRDVEVGCDFTAFQTLVIARVDITITLGRLLYLVAAYGFRAVKEYLHFQKKRKGGAAL